MASVRWQAWGGIRFKETKQLLAYFAKTAGQPVAFKANRQKPDGYRTGAGIVTFKDQVTAQKLLDAADSSGSIDVTSELGSSESGPSSASLVFVEPLNKSMQYITTEDWLKQEVLSHNQASAMLNQYYERELNWFPGFFPDEKGEGALTRAVAQQHAVFKDVATARNNKL
ncbi:hypothetical protein BCR37DRAFT_391923 [Protomyces lactucae-debilis]|uniref:Uncharacterized protein n=1 Tax=Protomyces lactucae-debilis TaxID=2754530 RepID=A0A1Y2FK36_PROLT|nr:uncharacterized protein BCR37DRAFT_391923 [Protomyces lactucae-debilis]ORY84333.1 hypothetical protein BCR37DRAFT_391923 [Protomyces lactucae-debilis]